MKVLDSEVHGVDAVADTEPPACDPRLQHADPAVAVPLDESFPWEDAAAVVAEVTRNVCGDVAPGSSLGAAHLAALRGALSPLAPALEVPGLLGADSPAFDVFDPCPQPPLDPVSFSCKLCGARHPSTEKVNGVDALPTSITTENGGAGWFFRCAAPCADRATT